MALPTRAELTAQADAANAAIEEHEARWGTDVSTMPTGQAERRERLLNGFRRAMAALEDHDTRAEKVEAVKAAAADPANVEPAFGPAAATRSRVAPFATGEGDDVRNLDTPAGLLARAVDAAAYVEGLPASARNLLVDTLEADRSAAASALTLAALDPNYRSAFGKYTADPHTGHLAFTPAEREAWSRVRAAMATTTESTGGALVPFTLDPAIVLTSPGVVDPFRQYATVVRTLTPSWTGVKSAGVNGEWLAEGAAAADASPTFSRFTIDAHKGAAYLVSSYELISDSNVAEQLPGLIADARGRMEAEAFISGSGSGAPKGIITALTGTASTVTTTTASTFTISDLFAAVNAVPTRARAGRSPVFLSSYPVLNHVRQFDTAGAASLWTTLGNDTPDRLLGYPVAEASAITSTITGHATIAIIGDLSRYTIVERLGTTVVPVPVVTDTGSGTPTGQYGWYAYWRTGGDVADPDAFRLVRVKA